MRAVQAYYNIKDRDLNAFKSQLDLLVWKLSVIRNKELGFITVLYTGRHEVELLERFGLLKLYDEVHYIDEALIHRINVDSFWAVPKFFAMETEIRRDMDFFIMDTDLVFMNDDILGLLDNDVLLWLNNEPFIFYNSLTDIGAPSGFKYPYYFSKDIRPVNTAIIRIKNPEIYKEWLRVVWAFTIDNWKRAKSQMMSVEQRFLANVLTKFGVKPKFYCDNHRNYDESHFHTWGDKGSLSFIDRLRRPWIKAMIMLIKEHSESAYNDIINSKEPQIVEVLDKWDSIVPCDIYNKYRKGK